jgi:hypothetical protein
MDEDVFQSLTIKEEKELVWVWSVASVSTCIWNLLTVLKSTAFS